MARRTVNLPDSVEELVRECIRDGESFSAAVTRMLEAGYRAEKGRRRPLSYAGAGEGPEDLAIRAEEYLRELIDAR